MTKLEIFQNSDSNDSKPVWKAPSIGKIDIKRTLSSGGSVVDLSGKAVGTSLFQ